MVELRPSKLKLDNQYINSMRFQNEMASIRHRVVDLIVTGRKEWLNSPDSVVFEITAPNLTVLASLACTLGKLGAKESDYWHASGEHCLVYWLKWE